MPSHGNHRVAVAQIVDSHMFFECNNWCIMRKYFGLAPYLYTALWVISNLQKGVLGAWGQDAGGGHVGVMKRIIFLRPKTEVFWVLWHPHPHLTCSTKTQDDHFGLQKSATHQNFPLPPTTSHEQPWMAFYAYYAI